MAKSMFSADLPINFETWNLLIWWIILPWHYNRV